MAYNNGMSPHDIEALVMTGRADDKPDQVEGVPPYSLGYDAMFNRLLIAGYREIYVGDMLVFQVLPYVRRGQRGLSKDLEFIAWVLEMHEKGVTNARITHICGADWAIVREIVSVYGESMSAKICTHPDCDRPRWTGPNGTNFGNTMCEDHQREYWRVKAAEKAAQKKAQKAKQKADKRTDVPSPRSEPLQCHAEDCSNQRYIDDKGRIFYTCEDHAPLENQFRRANNGKSAEGTPEASTAPRRTIEIKPFASPVAAAPAPKPAPVTAEAAPAPRVKRTRSEPTQQETKHVKVLAVDHTTRRMIHIDGQITLDTELPEDAIAADLLLETYDQNEYLVVQRGAEPQLVDEFSSVDAAYERIAAMYR